MHFNSILVPIFQFGNFFLINVNASDFIAYLRQTNASDEPDIAGSDDGDIFHFFIVFNNIMK